VLIPKNPTEKQILGLFLTVISESLISKNEIYTHNNSENDKENLDLEDDDG